LEDVDEEEGLLGNALEDDAPIRLLNQIFCAVDISASGSLETRELQITFRDFDQDMSEQSCMALLKELGWDALVTDGSGAIKSDFSRTMLGVVTFDLLLLTGVVKIQGDEKVASSAVRGGVMQQQTAFSEREESAAILLQASFRGRQVRQRQVLPRSPNLPTLQNLPSLKNTLEMTGLNLALRRQPLEVPRATTNSTAMLYSNDALKELTPHVPASLTSAVMDLPVKARRALFDAHMKRSLAQREARERRAAPPMAHRPMSPLSARSSKYGRAFKRTATRNALVTCADDESPDTQPHTREESEHGDHQGVSLLGGRDVDGRDDRVARRGRGVEPLKDLHQQSTIPSAKTELPSAQPVAAVAPQVQPGSCACSLASETSVRMDAPARMHNETYSHEEETASESPAERAPSRKRRSTQLRQSSSIDVASNVEVLPLSADAASKASPLVYRGHSDFM
jgi:hypothetical protein